MADDKKKPEGWNLEVDEWIIIAFFLLAILGTLVPTIVNFINSGQISFFGFKLSKIWDFLKSIIPFMKILGFVGAGAAAYGTISFNMKADSILKAEKAKVYPEIIPGISPDAEPVKSRILEKWEEILRLSESQNPSDWRLSIIEADIILNELLDKLQLSGDTMGEKLKTVEKSDFTTIESAWEAHKARNTIAHEGSNVLLNQRETARIISLYGAVFKEFQLI